MPNNEPSGLDNIIVRPVYLRAVNAIVQPEIQVPCSLYFFQKWLPRLGAQRWSLVLALRTICTQRQPDGTSRGEITRRELSNLLGVHEATISRVLNTTPSTIHHGWRILQALTSDDQETEWLGKFIPRLRYKYERDPVAAVTRRIGYIIDVVMDDPLVPEDEERLGVVLAEQVLQSLPGASVKADAALLQEEEEHSAPDDYTPGTNRGQKRRGQDIVPRGVKTQDAVGTTTVKTQNAPDTSADRGQYVASRSSVNQHNAPLTRGRTQNRPTLTLTTYYSYMNLTIDLTLTRKQDIRKAVAPLVDMAAERLYDHHSKGMFYSTVTQLYPKHLHVFTQALDEAEAEGKVNPEVIMGVVFVHAIRNLAAQDGIQLRLGKSKANEAVAMADQTMAVEEEDEASEAAHGSREEVQQELEEENLARSKTTSVAGVGVSAKQLWPAVLNELQSRTSKANYEMWLRNCEVVGFQGDVVIVGVPSVFARDWITDRLLAPIQSALRELMRRDVRVRCEVQGRRGSRR